MVRSPQPSPTGPRSVPTFCRICEAHCGLVVDLEWGPGGARVAAVRPDREHPVSRGYACVKGLALGAMHHDPHRLDYPLVRVGGELRRATWPEALRAAGRRLHAAISAGGPRAVGLYTGNPSYFSLQHVLGAQLFAAGIGTPNRFSSNSIDANPKFEVATGLFGASVAQPVPDLARAQFALLIGTNPMVSQMSIVVQPRAVETLQAIERRGGRVVHVDPRRTETADRVGEHVPIRPGTDAYLLAALCHVLAFEGAHARARRSRLEHTVDGAGAFMDAVRPWTPERAARVTSVSARRMRDLAHALAGADGGVVYVSTGVSMGPFGSLAFWFAQGASLLAGQYGRPGGTVLPRGAFDVLALAKGLGLSGEDPQRAAVSGWHRVAGAFPVGALAEEIEAPDGRGGRRADRIRALVVSAGNPLHSVPGLQLDAALDALDSLVVIDIYPSETAMRADVVLPATGMLERSDFPASFTALQLPAHAQWTPAVVPPLAERRPEFAIFSDLLAATQPPSRSWPARAGLRLEPVLRRVFGRRVAGAGNADSEGAWLPHMALAALLRWGGRTSLAALRAMPRGVTLPEDTPGRILGPDLPTPTGRIQLAPATVLADLPRLAAEEHALARPGVLRLIGRRDRRAHNSWMHQNPGVSQPSAGPRLHVHPDDACAAGLSDGATARVEVEGGAVFSMTVRVHDDVAPGVVSAPHGWGHRASGHPRARALRGMNVNPALPGGSAALEPVSGQAVFVAHAVTLTSVEGADL